MCSRVAFLVDGFNLYHSVRDIHSRTGKNYRWLDLRSLCASFLPSIGNNAILASVYYFSALAHHVEARNPGAVKRHLAYIRALETTGVAVELGQFKPKKEFHCECPNCHTKFTLTRYEEKETDVSIACKLIELTLGDDVDTIVIVSGDTDLIPGIKTATRLRKKPIYMLYPVGRRNQAFHNLVPGFRLKTFHYERHQLPSTVGSGSMAVCRPRLWS